MKIALCLSGLPRFISEAAPNIKSCLIQNYDVDVFAHTWYSQNQVMRTDGSDMWSSFRYTENPQDNIKQHYNIKDIIVEEPINFYSNSILHKYNFIPTLEIFMSHFLTESGKEYYINMVHSMWYSIYKCNQLKLKFEQDNNIKYDIVIRSRFDTVFSNPIDFQRYDINHVNVANTAPDKQTRDWLAFSTSNNMDIYSNLFNELELINSQLDDDERANEFFLNKHMLNHNIHTHSEDLIEHFIRP
jgi:hypothetical protein